MVTACPQCRAIVQTRDEVPVGGILRCHACGSRFSLGTPGSRDLRLKRDPSELDLPAPGGLDEYVEPPEIGPPVRLGGDLPFAAYTRVYHRIVGQLGADTTFALLLLALHVLVALAYGVGEMARIAASLPAEAVGPSPDMLVRVWRPLALYEVMTVGMAAMAHWVGFMVAVRLLGMEHSSGGFCASWALASIPGTICLGAAWFAGWTAPSIAIPSTLIALPVVLLFTCAIFSVRITVSLIITLMCMALAGPVSVFSAKMYGKYAQYSAAADEQRLAAEGADRPAIALTEDGLPERIPTNPRVREMAEVLVASAEGAGLPTSQAAAPPAAVRPERLTTPPTTPAQATDLTRGVAIDAWNGPESVQQVIWPAVAGEIFGTLRADALGNHVIDLWLVRDLSSQGSLRIGGGPAASYAISPSGNLLVRVLGTASPIAEVWNVRASRRQTQVSLSGGTGTPAALGFVDDDSFAIVWRGQSRMSVSIYDGQSGLLSRTIAWPDAEKRAGGAGGGQGSSPAHPEAVWISPDGKLLAGVDATPQICVLETAGGRVAERWRVNLPAGQSAAVSGIAFARDNGRLAVLADESQSGGQSVLFVAESGVTELTAIPFSNAVWKLAGCSGPSGRRGRVIDWISDTELLLYGELVVDVASGALTQSMHSREPGKPARGGAFGQYRLPDGSFLLEPAADGQGRKSALQRLRTENSR